MKEDNSIDQFFRDRLFDKEVAYNEADWIEAEKLLIDHSKKRFFLYRFRYYLSALLLLIISSSAYVFTASDQDSVARSEVQMNSNLSTADNGIDDKNIEFDNVQNENAILETPSSKTVKPTTSNIKENSRPNEIRTESVDNTVSEEVNSESYTGQKRVDDKGPISATIINAHEVPDQDETTDIIGINALITLMPAAESTDNIAADQNSSHTLLASNVISGSDPSADMEAIETNNDPLILMQMAPVNTSVSESVLIGEPDPDTEKIREKTGKISGWTFIAGAGLTPTYKSEGITSKSNYSLFVGIGYEKLLLPNFSAEIRAVTSKRNAYGALYDVSQTTYDFGFKTIETSYQFKSLVYLELPIIINYYLSPLHRISLGMQYARLFRANYTSTSQESSTFGVTDPVEEESGDKSGIFNSNDFALYLGYQYTISERTRVGSNIQVALLNSANSAYLGNSKYNNHQLRFYLTYRLFK